MPNFSRVPVVEDGPTSKLAALSTVLPDRLILVPVGLITRSLEPVMRFVIVLPIVADPIFVRVLFPNAIVPFAAVMFSGPPPVLVSVAVPREIMFVSVLFWKLTVLLPDEIANVVAEGLDT